MLIWKNRRLAMNPLLSLAQSHCSNRWGTIGEESVKQILYGNPDVKRQLLPFAVLFIVLLPAAVHSSEPVVVELWPGKVPGDVGIKGKENSRIYQSAIIKGPTR